MEGGLPDVEVELGSWSMGDGGRETGLVETLRGV